MSLPSMILYGRKKQLFITKEKKILRKKKVIMKIELTLHWITLCSNFERTSATYSPEHVSDILLCIGLTYNAIAELCFV